MRLKNEIGAIFLTLFICAMAPSTLLAQNEEQAATDTTVTPDDTAAIGLVNESYSQNSAAAERAYQVLTSRHLPSAVPHLDPVLVRNAMLNGTYTGTFTFVIGHRGFHSAPGCPENSACALAAAFDVGADATEFDVKLAAPGPSGNVGVVFGHDYTLGREQAAWSSKTLPNNSNWDFFCERPTTNTTATCAFPAPDPAYARGTITSPFGINFTGNNNLGDNDKRESLYEDQQVGDMTFNARGNWTLRDTFGTTTSNFYELNLYQYLYLAQKYFPLMPWLDIKNKNVLIQAGKIITQAQSDFATAHIGASNGTSGPIHAVAFKLGPSVLLGSASKSFSDRVTSVRSLLNINDVSYFFVFGTGDLDSLVTFGQTQTSCKSSGCTALGAALNAITTVCQKSDGCLGVELGHKYPNAPTQTLYNSLVSLSTKLQVAGFQTVPQYEWFWQSLPQSQQLTTYGAWYGRTDGSCCFSLLQSNLLNSSTNFGSETGDSRSDYGYNESTFSTITTDEPYNLLKDLFAQGKRPSATVAALAASNPTIHSGGTDVGILKDGLYAIVNANSGLAIAEPSSSTTGTQLVQYTADYDKKQLWYLTYLGDQQYGFLNASDSLDMVNQGNGQSNGTPVVAYLLQGPGGQTWSLATTGDGTFTVLNQLQKYCSNCVNLALDVANSSPNPGSGIVLNTPVSGAQSQRWLFEPVLPPTDTLTSVSSSLPGAPIGLYATANATGFETLTWAAPAYTANGTVTYNVSWSKSGVAVGSRLGLTTPTLALALSANTTYTFSVVAIVNGAQGPASTVTATTGPVTVGPR
jgi:hypothetical protein